MTTTTGDRDERPPTGPTTSGEKLGRVLGIFSFLLLVSSAWRVFAPRWVETVPPVVTLIVAVFVLLALLVLLVWPKDRLVDALNALRSSVSLANRR